jgi:HTH-type transcriptional regulator, competence development regulator
MRQRENEVVGQVLRAFRDKAGLSQEDAAHAAGLHRAQYGHYEQGRNAVSFVLMLRIAKALDVSIEELSAAVEQGLPERSRQ